MIRLLCKHQASVITWKQGRYCTAWAVFQEPEVLIVIVRLKDLKVVESTMLIRPPAQHLPACDDHLVRVHLNRRRRCDERLVRPRSEHVVGVRMSERNLLRLQCR